METKTRIFEVRQVVERVVEDKKDSMIFELNEEGEWVYHAPNAQNHTEEQVEEILKHLKMLNNQ